MKFAVTMCALAQSTAQYSILKYSNSSGIVLYYTLRCAVNTEAATTIEHSVDVSIAPENGKISIAMTT